MGCSREHITGSYFFYRIILLGEELEVAGEGGGVAADVDHPVGRHLHDGVDQLRGQPLSRRVDNNHVRSDALFPELFGGICRVAAEESRVTNAVVGGVALGVFDRLGDDLDADQRLAFVRHGQADGARAAVQVEQRFAAGQLSIFLRLRVQALCLGAVDLVERLGRDRKAQPAERVGDRIVAVFCIGALTKDHVGILAIHVEDDALDGGVFFF